MNLLLDSSLGNYSRMGDVAVIALCIVVSVLLLTSYVVRNKSFRVFSAIVGFLFISASVNIGYNEILMRPELMDGNPYMRGLVYSLRVFYHMCLFNVFFLFCLYATIITNMEKARAKRIAWFGMSLFIVCIAVDIIFTVTGISFKIDEHGIAKEGFPVFIVGYSVLVLFLASLMFRIRRLVYKRVFWGFYAVTGLAVIIRYTQFAIGDNSLTTLTFTLPVLAMLYIMHVNPYDATIGTLDISAMEDMVKNLYNKKQEFIIMSMLLPDFNGEGKSLPDVVREQTREFTIHHFRNGTLFQVNNGQIIMIARKDSNPDYNDWMQKILRTFLDQYRVHKLNFKIVYGDSFMNDVGDHEYLTLIDDIHSHIPTNTIRRITIEDINRYKEREYIVSELEDIYKKCDLNDPRVLVLAQPVFNVKTRRFDTAEALMRLKLEKTGIVSPLLFIPIAESRGFIHVLTKIILNKTCQTIRELCANKVEFKRISINVSTIELKDNRFCSDINKILKENNISGDKVAIELTESQNQEDYTYMKERIESLHQEGIKFYLDDFGTGYSNMERILELPFDVIKFDRSMVIASGQDERSGRIVENLAKLFNDFNYFVLYEGIEDSVDENRCVSMSASYLQGYKYSKPVPINELESFFTRIDA